MRTATGKRHSQLLPLQLPGGDWALTDRRGGQGSLPPAVVIPVCDYGQFEAHEAFVSRLRTNHSRKGFGHWSLTRAADESYATDKSRKQEGADFAIRLTFSQR
jgi:hypothetical protein